MQPALRGQATADGGESGAWLDGDAAAAVACDAAMAPYVTGDVNPAVLEDLVRLCVRLDHLRRGAGRASSGSDGEQPAPAPDTARAWEALGQAVIGKAVDLLRDRCCRRAGGCSQPASTCEVHHVTHKADGGKTSTRDCVLLCSYHHQVMIHRQGWTLVLNPDGTTTAWNKDRTKILHGHGPPARAG